MNELLILFKLTCYLIKVCQYLISNPNSNYDLGDQESAVFNYVDDVLTMTFTANKDYPR